MINKQSITDTQSINAEDINNEIFSIWSTDVFRDLHKNNRYFNQLIKKLEIAPIFFFETNNNKQKNHLTSFYRLIAYRSYENKYIQDLYYFHELCHMVNYTINKDKSYMLWSRKLNENEFYASLMSEAIIYFYDETLYKKTFSPLWANIFIHDVINDKNNIKTEYGLYYNIKNNEDILWFNKLEKNEINLFITELEMWPQNIQNIIKRRKLLREINDISFLFPSEIKINSYNFQREKWIHRWQTNYLKIDSMIEDLIKTKDTKKYIDTIQKNTSKEGICFELNKV